MTVRPKICAKFCFGVRRFRDATDREWQVIMLRFSALHLTVFGELLESRMLTTA